MGCCCSARTSGALLTVQKTLYSEWLAGNQLKWYNHSAKWRQLELKLDRHRHSSSSNWIRERIMTLQWERERERENERKAIQFAPVFLSSTAVSYNSCALMFCRCSSLSQLLQSLKSASSARSLSSKSANWLNWANLSSFSIDGRERLNEGRRGRQSSKNTGRQRQM